MNAPSHPLDSYPSFRTARAWELGRLVEEKLGAQVTAAPADGTLMQAKGNRASLSVGDLWLCAYGLPTTIKFPEGEYLKVQFNLAGVGTSSIGRQTIAVTADQACVLAGDVEVWFGPEFQQLVWRVPKSALAAKMAAMTGNAVVHEPAFDPALSLTQAQGAIARQLVGSLVRAVEVGDAPSKMVLAEIEQAMMVALLAANAHHVPELLLRPSDAAPWQVRRAEQYIEANWDKPLTIEDLVAAAGTSARSLFRTFRQSRGCSPLEFARRVRLNAAKRMLEHPGQSTNVTAVAMACGFRDLGHFTKSFRQAFGVLPSDVLKKSS